MEHVMKRNKSVLVRERSLLFLHLPRHTLVQTYAYRAFPAFLGKNLLPTHMNYIEKFVAVNMKETTPSDINRKHYKAGISHIELLESAFQSVFDPISVSRAMYIRNLVTKCPQSFEIPNDLPHRERALMFLSFFDFKSAKEALECSQLKLGFIGATRKGRTGAESSVVVADLQGTANIEFQPFSYKGYVFEDFSVSSLLTPDELLFLYISCKEIQETEDNEILREIRMEAIILRALCSEQCDAFRVAFLLELGKLKNEIGELEKYADCLSECGVSFSAPIVLKYEVLATLGFAYLEARDYGTAYKYISYLPFPMEHITCLVGIGRLQEAVAVITKEITRLGSPKSREDLLYLSSLYTKLGSLQKNPTNFDQANSAFPTPKAYQEKALLYYNEKNYLAAIGVYSEALKYFPNNENILFAYGCALIEVSEFGKALGVFKKLKNLGVSNDAIDGNLSYCHYKTNEIIESLESLRPSSIYDQKKMKSYLMIALKHNIWDHILWGISRVQSKEFLQEVVNYLLNCSKESKSKIIESLKDNPFLTSEDIIFICS